MPAGRRGDRARVTDAARSAQGEPRTGPRGGPRSPQPGNRHPRSRRGDPRPGRQQRPVRTQGRPAGRADRIHGHVHRAPTRRPGAPHRPPGQPGDPLGRHGTRDQEPARDPQDVHPTPPGALHGRRIQRLVRQAGRQGDRAYRLDRQPTAELRPSGQGSTGTPVAARRAAGIHRPGPRTRAPEGYPGVHAVGRRERRHAGRCAPT